MASLAAGYTHPKGDYFTNWIEPIACRAGSQKESRFPRRECPIMSPTVYKKVPFLNDPLNINFISANVCILSDRFCACLFTIVWNVQIVNISFGQAKG